MENKLEKYMFMGPFLRLLEKSGFFSRMVGIMLRVLAALIILGSLATIFKVAAEENRRQSLHWGHMPPR